MNWEKPGYVGLASAPCCNVVRFRPKKHFHQSQNSIIKTRILVSVPVVHFFMSTPLKLHTMYLVKGLNCKGNCYG